MASFVVPPTVEEYFYPLGVDEDITLCVWAISGRRSPEDAARAFLDAGYNYLHSKAHPMYHMQLVANNAMNVHFVNPLDTRLLYGRCYYRGCEMVVFTCANIFTNYNRFFPMGQYIRLLRFMEQQQQATNQKLG